MKAGSKAGSLNYCSVSHCKSTNPIDHPSGVLLCSKHFLCEFKDCTKSRSDGLYTNYLNRYSYFFYLIFRMYCRAHFELISGVTAQPSAVTVQPSNPPPAAVTVDSSSATNVLPNDWKSLNKTLHSIYGYTGTLNFHPDRKMHLRCIEAMVADNHPDKDLMMIWVEKLS